jgi:hypothetical protein
MAKCINKIGFVAVLRIILLATKEFNSENFCN